ncbi:MAG: trimeric intracellular cation channel family protein [Paludibacteraceae bacterium]|nr:trimeric intracellular cation channel family protein [Paludibacteraceae bacterium]
MIGLTEILENIGTFAFAISGIRLAAKKDFDLFGAYVVGLVTAIGGGTIRDLCIGETPFWMLNANYLIWSGVALLFVILFRKYLIHLNITFFIFDTIGLALFTVVGMEKTLSAGYDFWVAIVMGCITGAAGGVFRDIFINEIPLIFRKEIYAIACIIGGFVYYGCHQLGVDDSFSQIFCAVSVAAARIIAVRFRIGLPHIKGEQE